MAAEPNGVTNRHEHASLASTLVAKASKQTSQTNRNGIVMEGQPQISAEHFFETLACAKLIELAYRVGLPATTDLNVQPTAAQLQQSQVDQVDLVYLDPTAESAWTTVTEVLMHQRQRIESLETTLRTRNNELKAVKSSRSWRLTAPLRRGRARK